MNYFKIYEQLMNRAHDRTLTGYYEKHHIMPRCMGGDDSPSNLITLTPEEHYLAHQLLVKMYPNNIHLIHAAMLMTIHDSHLRVGNKLYGWLRRKASCERKEIYRSDPSHPIHLGLFKGRSHTPKSKSIISKHTSIALRKKYEREIFCFNMSGILIAKFTNLVEAAEFCNTSPSNIKYCAEGKSEHIKGYLWSYINVCPQVPKRLKTKNRKVNTDAGIFDSVTEVVRHFGFKSTTAVRRRCLSKAPHYSNWFYLEGPESLDN